MAGLARTIELQRAEVAAVMSFKTRLIDYLQRFMGDPLENLQRKTQRTSNHRNVRKSLKKTATRRRI